MRSFACGEPLCKQSFEAEVPADKPWPIRCPSCGRSLYPEEVLQSTALDDLDRHRGPLMRVVASKLVPVTRSDLSTATSTSAPTAGRSVLDEMIEAADAPTRPKRPLGIIVAVVALGVIVAGLAWYFSHR